MADSQMTTEELLRVLGNVEEDDEFSEAISLYEDDLESITDRQEQVDDSPVLPSTSHTTQETPDNNWASTSASASTSRRDPRRRQTEPSYQWTSVPHVPALTSFDEFTSGLHLEVTENITEFDIFQKFLDLDFMSFIVDMTNLFHSRFVLNVDLRMHSRLQRWHDVSIPELYIFFALLMLMTRNRHLTLEEHWSTDVLLSSPIFSKLMPRNRFCTILSMLHFSRHSEETNVLSKVDTCINHAREKYKKLMTPYKNLCIDESIVPFKGRLSIRQYLPKKRNRFGIKLFVMCDVQTGIIIDFIVYCGAATEIIDPCNLGVGGAVVSTLIRDFFGSNRHLYVDNWYTSPVLLDYLHRNNIYACGTVKKNRVGMPRFNNTIKRGEIQAKYCPPMTALKWRDKKDIFILSTIHSDIMAPSLKEDRATGLPVMKPQAVLDYSKNMGSVDTADMLLSSIQCIRKTIKWYKKLFLHIIDMHVLNSFFCYKEINNMPNLHFAKFHLSLIRQIIENFHSHNTLPQSISSSHNPLRILSKNNNDHMPTLMGKYRRCRQCAVIKKRKETKYACKICKVYLCAAPCFEKYHSSDN
ncbi:piggyBac transposable element-derived protein 4-like [Trichoplusia ni]|uniref:PiggyBac transposable element-derived protein 4-like n=1 Tax=Trichoplusia ni TaxID=7111 RepID=A0A7E5W6T0_TRINI|nr:piggyBac transposable element-derived protein 4-like [Trichoplusia ni]